MVCRFLITAILVFIASTLPARAQTPCGVIEAVLDTAYIVQDIQTVQDNHRRRLYIAALETNAAHISLSGLIPDHSAEDFDKESEALSLYLSRLRGAIDAHHEGHDDKAQQLLGLARNPEFSQAINSLNYYWNCQTHEDVQGIDMSGTYDESVYSAAPQAELTSADSRFAKAVTGKSNISGGRASSPLYGKKSALGGVLTHRSNIFFVIVCMLLLGGIYYFRQRAKAFKIREERSYLYMPIAISTDQRNHTITLVDISMNGAKVKHDGALRGHKTVQIKLGENWYAGDIMWSNDFFSGVRFKKPITKMTFNRLVDSVS